MPITPTEKIWMNGELVPWDEARIHVLTHTLHYGMGVFEGIRAYETADGPGIFRLTDHINRMFQSAQILGMEIPYTPEELVAATKATVASTGLASCYIRPIAYFGYGEMGLNTLPCSVDVSIACWPWGAYLGDDALTKGVRMKISQLDPPRPQHHAPGVEDHGQLRQLVAGQGRGAQGRLRRGPDAQPAGVRVRVHRRERLRGPQGPVHHPAAVVGRPGGHHPVAPCRPSPPTSASRSSWASWPAPTSTSPRRCSSAAPRPRCRPVSSVDDREIPSPGAMTVAIGEEYHRTVRGEVDRYKDWVEHAE